jgi:hypothetical protein
MNTTQLARRAIRLFNNSMVPKHTNRHNQRSWINAVQELGDKWAFIQRVPKAASK